jgi:protein-S-isoprenylcysteine O-methyltransferase Ste14
MWDAPSVVQTRRASWITLAVGIVLTTLGFLPIMQTWGLYFLPLAYLVYIGAAVVVIGVGVLIRYWATGGNLKYVEKADAAMARIQEVQIVETELNGVTTYTPHFTVQYAEPARFGGEPVSRQQILAAPAITAEKLAVSQLRFEAGDWLPVVWFPEKAETTARLYDTLGLNETGIWTTQDDPSPTPLWMSLSLIVLGGLMFFSLLWSLWSMGSYSPIAAPSWNVIALSVGLGVLLGAVLAGLIIWQDRHEKRRTQAVIRSGHARERIC